MPHRSAEFAAATRLLANIVWHSLAGAQAKFSSGTATARRYARGFSAIIGFADADNPDFGALAPYCDLDEHFYVGAWTGRMPDGWQLHADTVGHQMVWDRETPADDPELAAVPLDASHVPQMLELVKIRPPGPFAIRTRELGDYFGVFEGGRLVAMAGERMEAGALREVSGVCTHPDFEGRGLARRLIAKLVRQQMRRGQIPFLHVMRDNVHAREVYARMGFRLYQEVALRVVSRCGS
jgi:ribosomal protein S18 acetylase RimI-like enzyme